MTIEITDFEVDWKRFLEITSKNQGKESFIATPPMNGVNSWIQVKLIFTENWVHNIA